MSGPVNESEAAGATPAAGKILIEERWGHWVESAYSGVTCSICGAWSPVVKPVCPNRHCGAKLTGITYRNWPRGKYGSRRGNADGRAVLYI